MAEIDYAHRRKRLRGRAGGQRHLRHHPAPRPSLQRWCGTAEYNAGTFDPCPLQRHLTCVIAWSLGLFVAAVVLLV